MPSQVSYPLFRQPLVDAHGYVLRPWQQFFQAFFVRMGADEAMTNLELEAAGAATAATAATNAAAITAETLLSAFTQSPAPRPSVSVEALFTAPMLRAAPDIERLFDDRGTQGLAGLAVRKNSGAVVGTRRQLNVIEGQAIALTVADDGAEIDLTVAVAGGASQTYTVTNVTTDRGYDADLVLVSELADVLGTLIADLRTRGLVA